MLKSRFVRAGKLVRPRVPRQSGRPQGPDASARPSDPPTLETVTRPGRDGVRLHALGADVRVGHRDALCAAKRIGAAPGEDRARAQVASGKAEKGEMLGVVQFRFCSVLYSLTLSVTSGLPGPISACLRRGQRGYFRNEWLHWWRASGSTAREPIPCTHPSSPSTDSKYPFSSPTGFGGACSISCATVEMPSVLSLFSGGNRFVSHKRQHKLL